jgi:superfamily II DNA/RNA helicase
MLHPEVVATHRGTRVTRNVDHAFYPVPERQKEQLLLEILRREEPSKGLIFTATREATSGLALVLRRHRYEVVSLSSLLSQANRERALETFRSGGCQFLVATDVAARGLDITDIDLVVNFDVPMVAEDYVHRIGRTGRAERSGRAITLITELDRRRVADIERLLEQQISRIELEGFNYRQESRPPRSAGGRGPGGRDRSRSSGGRRRSESSGGRGRHGGKERSRKPS